jgi:hypothetical protein
MGHLTNATSLFSPLTGPALQKIMSKFMGGMGGGGGMPFVGAGMGGAGGGSDNVDDGIPDLEDLPDLE